MSTASFRGCIQCHNPALLANTGKSTKTPGLQVSFTESDSAPIPGQHHTMRQTGSSQTSGISLRLVVGVVVLSLFGITVSSVRFLAAVIASTHHASLHDSSLIFENEKATWSSTWDRTFSHIDEVASPCTRRMLRVLHSDIYRSPVLSRPSVVTIPDTVDGMLTLENRLLALPSTSMSIMSKCIRSLQL